jgi:hypothetical protein
MTFKNSIGMAFIVAGFALGLSGLHRHRVRWVVAGSLLFVIGLLLIQRPKRGCWSQGAVGDYPGGLGDLSDLTDWGGGHHSSDGHSSGHMDLPSSDFDV